MTADPVSLTIVVPHLNSGGEIVDALGSVPERGNVEVLVIDGQSTDGSIAAVEARRWQSVRVHVEPPRGVYAAMNQGIEHARGTWIYFMGADDRLHPHLDFDALLARLAATQADVLYGDVEMNGQRMHGEFDLEKLSRSTIPHQAMFFRRSSFERFGTFDTTYAVKADYALNIRWFCTPGCRFQYEDLVVARYAPGGMSATTHDRAFDRDIENLFLGAFEAQLGRRACYQRMRWSAEHDLATGDFLRGLRKVHRSGQSLAATFRDAARGARHRVGAEVVGALSRSRDWLHARSGR